jgi:hypothetical protein
MRENRKRRSTDEPEGNGRSPLGNPTSVKNNNINNNGLLFS